MSRAVKGQGPPVLRDYYQRLIEPGAPAEIRYRGVWRRGRVVELLRKFVRVDIPTINGLGRRTPIVRPQWIAVLGPTEEDVRKTLPMPAAPHDRTKLTPPHPQGE